MTAHTPTPTPIKEKISAMFVSSADRLIYLCQRWADEKDYEDWTEYADEMAKLMPKDLIITRATKRPFGFEFSANGFPDGAYRMTATCGGTVEWKRIARAALAKGA